MYLNGNKSFRGIFEVKLEEYKLCLSYMFSTWWYAWVFPRVVRKEPMLKSS